MARHASLAEQLQALLAYRDRPVGVAEDVELTNSDVSPTAQTNWRVTPPTETNPEDLAGLRIERRSEIRPTMRRIEREIIDVPVCKLGNPSGDHVERNATGQVVAIRDLGFSDGTQTEKAFRRSIDGSVIQYDARLPIGAMVGTKDSQAAVSGSGEDQSHVAQSNRYFSDMLGGARYRHISNGTRRGGKSYSRSESASMLEAAWANTAPGSYRFTRCPDGLPSASSKVADSFLGMCKTTCAKGGSIPWQDMASSTIGREIWEAAINELDAKDKRTLDAAMTADGFEEIGRAMGHFSKYAVSAAKKRLIAANDNLVAALQKVAA